MSDQNSNTPETVALPSSELGRAAIQYARHGWPVFPLKPRGKEPLTEHGHKEATCDTAKIAKWWTRHPNANIGVRTGGRMWVLDLDCKNGARGMETYERLSSEKEICETLQQTTGSGGRHLFFSNPGFDVPCFGHRKTETVGLHGCDVRGDGGYVVLPPSIHPDTSNAYEWDGLEPFYKQSMLEAPMVLLQPVAILIEAREHNSAMPLEGEIPEGQRNDTLTSYAGSLRRQGAKPEEILAKLADKNERCCKPPLSLHEVKTIAYSIGSYPPGSTGNASEDPAVVQQQVENLLDQIRATHDSNLVYENIDVFAQLSKAQLFPVADELVKQLRSLRRKEFLDAVQERKQHSKTNVPATDCEGEYRFQSGRLIRLKELKNGQVQEIWLAEFQAIIVAEIVEDNGVDQRHHFEIDCTVDTTSRLITIPSNRFNAMEWPIEHLGAHAIIYPGQKEWVRTGIQLLSQNIEHRKVYSHTGWRQVDSEHIYLHAGGAIGKGGVVDGVRVRLNGALDGFSLNLCSNADELRERVQSSLALISVAPAQIAYPLLAAIYRACIKQGDFTLWLSGQTGVFKSELAALAQQHYGAEMNARKLPGNFISTGNALETLGFHAKDALLVVDDFSPYGSTQDQARHNGTAERLLRAVGNNQGRGRLHADATLNNQKAPRGLVLVTGEDLPRSQSIRARSLIVEVKSGDVNTKALTLLQQKAAKGYLSSALGEFIRWMAGNYEDVQRKFAERALTLRAAAPKAHSRTPGIIAELQAALELFFAFAEKSQALDPGRGKALSDAAWGILKQVAVAQRKHQEASDPVRRFLMLVRSAVMSGSACVLSVDGSPPENPQFWGWQWMAKSDGGLWQARSTRVGWIEGDSLYLDPVASYACAQRTAQASGEPLTVTEATLKKRLNERGLLVSTDTARQTLTVRRQIMRERVAVLHLSVHSLLDDVGSADGDVGKSQET